MEARRLLRNLGTEACGQFLLHPERPLARDADLSLLLFGLAALGHQVHMTSPSRALALWKLAVRLGHVETLVHCHLIPYTEPWRQPVCCTGYQLLEPVPDEYSDWMVRYRSLSSEESVVIQLADDGYTLEEPLYHTPETVQGAELQVAGYLEPLFPHTYTSDRLEEVVERETHQCLICLDDCQPKIAACCLAVYCHACLEKLDQCAHCRSEELVVFQLAGLQRGLLPPLERCVFSATTALVEQIRESVPDAVITIVCDQVTSERLAVGGVHIRTVEGSVSDECNIQYTYPHPASHLIFAGALTTSEYDTWLSAVIPVCSGPMRVYWITPHRERTDAPGLVDDHGVGEIQPGLDHGGVREQIERELRAMVQDVTDLPPSLPLTLARRAVELLQDRAIAYQLEHGILVSLQTSVGKGVVECVRIKMLGHQALGRRLHRTETLGCTIDPVQIMMDQGIIPSQTKVRYSNPGSRYTMHPLQAVGADTERVAERLMHPELRGGADLLERMLADYGSL